MNPDQTASTALPFPLRAPAGRVALLFLFHAAVFSVCYLLAWLLRFDFDIPSFAVRNLKLSLFPVVGLQLVFGLGFGFYRGWWSYVGIRDVLNVVAGLTAALAVLLLLWHTGTGLGLPARWVKPPRSVLVIDWAFATLALFGARVFVRLGRDRLLLRKHVGERRRVLIIGAGDAGEALAREIEHRRTLGMDLAGFVDDDQAKWGSQIRGIAIHGPIANIAALADRLAADEALIAIPSASGKRIREIIAILAAADLKFKTIPGMDQLVAGKVHVTQLRPVNVEDLLRRQRIELPGDPVRALFRGRRVLITGAGGTIGCELASQVLQFEPATLVLVERSEFGLYEVLRRVSGEAPDAAGRVVPALVDVTDTEIIEDLIGRERPEIVLHAAAHKHVPLGEQNPGEYVRNNCLATRDLAEVCHRHGVERFVLISTDKAIHPTSVMGASKRAAEIALLDAGRRRGMQVMAVRFGNVIGSSGSVIPLFIEQIASGGPVTVTHPEVTRYFLRTSEAVSLVLQAATLPRDGCIFMLDMGEPVRIADLALDLIRLSNQTEQEIPITYIGLRPGEKLFEEIRLEGESIRPTDHPQIVVTEAPQPEPAVVGEWLARVRRERKSSTAAVIEALRELVPEYVPSEERPDAAPPTPSPARVLVS